MLLSVLCWLLGSLLASSWGAKAATAILGQTTHAGMLRRPPVLVEYGISPHVQFSGEQTQMYIFNNLCGLVYMAQRVTGTNLRFAYETLEDIGSL